MKHIKLYENSNIFKRYAIVQIGDMDKTIIIIEILNVNEPFFNGYGRKEIPVEIQYHISYKNGEKRIYEKDYIYSTTSEWLNKTIVEQSNNIEELIEMVELLLNTKKYGL